MIELESVENHTEDCKDCIHYEVCSDFKNNICEECNSRHDEYRKYENGACPFYKDKAELPCKVGDIIYQTDGIRIYESKIKYIVFDCGYSDCGYIAFDENEIGHTIFLTREEAEKRLYPTTEKEQ